MDQQDKQKVMTIQEVQNMWDNMTVIYPSFDSAPQAFYFGIINMLQIEKAKNILEVGCGRCLLVPYCLELMSPEASYCATDLSPKMIEAAQKKMQSYLDKFDSKLTLEQWSQKHHFTLKAANGQQVIEKDKKFDRIICNMVLMLTETPEKMLKSLYDQAEEGCLLGVAVWGRRELNLIQEQIERVVAQLNVEAPKMRSNFHLYNKVPALAEQAGWKTMAMWEQVSVFPYLQASELDSYAKSMAMKMVFLPEEKRNWVYEEYMRRQINRLDKEKQALTFPAQIIILRK